MKTWLKITLGTLLALVVLAGVGAAGYRLGITQNPEVVQKLAEIRAERISQFQKQNVEKPPQADGQNLAPRAQNFDPRNAPGRGVNPHARFDRGFDRRGGFFFPFLGLVRLVILGALVWFAYQYFKKSGWKLVKETPAPVAPIEENKEA